MARIEIAAEKDREPNEDFMRAYCWEKNQSVRRAGYDRWWLVRTINDQPAYDSRTGDEVARLWKLMNGWYPDYVGWSAEKLASEFRILRSVIRGGMPGDVFKQIRFAA
jgi:hypothetical protein